VHVTDVDARIDAFRCHAQRLRAETVS
jgi:hypothetical protein